jgi:hypothetical protein
MVDHNPYVVAWPTSFDTGTLMGGLKLKHDFNGFIPFAGAGLAGAYCPDSTTPNLADLARNGRYRKARLLRHGSPGRQGNAREASL